MDIAVHVQLLGKLDFQGISRHNPLTNFLRKTRQSEIPILSTDRKFDKPKNERSFQILIFLLFIDQTSEKIRYKRELRFGAIVQTIALKI